MKATTLKKLPRANLSLTAMGLGCSQMGGLYRETTARDVADVFSGAWAAGLRYFDTAPFYGYTRSEHRLGLQLVDIPRDHYVLSTKVGRLMRPDATVRPGEDGWAIPYPFRPYYDYRYDGVMRSFEDSLQRLGVSRIDILYVHDIGRSNHAERQDDYWAQLTTGGGFRALDELRRGGQVAAVGLGVNEWEVVRDSLQEIDLDCTMLAGRYTLLEQDSLKPLLDDCVKRGTAIVIAGVFNSGILAGSTKFNYDEAPAAVVERVRALQTVCAEFSVPIQAAALQFPMAHPAVVSCVVGTRTAAQLTQNLAWFEHPIPDALWDALRARGLVDPAAPVPGSLG